MTDDERDILIELKNDVGWIKKIMGNHLKHHWAVTLAVVTCSLCTIGSLLIVFICRGP